MIKKSQQLLAEIKIGVEKMLTEGHEKVTLPKPFSGFNIQIQDNPSLPSEPLDYKEFGIEKSGHFFLVVTKL